MLTESHDEEQIIARVAALDIGKTEAVCCVRVPAGASTKKRLQEMRMFFHILGAVAEFEHALMSERTREGLAAARARGRTGGQEPKLGPRQVALAQAMYDETGADGKRRYTVAQIVAEFGVTRPTIYRHVGVDSAHTPAARGRIHATHSGRDGTDSDVDAAG